MRISGHTYVSLDFDRVTLRGWLEVQQETASLGRVLTRGEVARMQQEVAALPTRAAKSAYPDLVWLIAATVWASRKVAGEEATFADALDLSLADLEFLPEPEDHKAPANPPKARPRSGRAAKPRPARVAPKTTSSATSTPD